MEHHLLKKSTKYHIDDFKIGVKSENNYFKTFFILTKITLCPTASSVILSLKNYQLI